MSTTVASLRRTQELFWQLITHPTGARNFLAQTDAPTRSEIENLFTESPDFPRTERLEVYAEAYFFRLLEALSEIFPIAKWRVGDRQFHNLITDYVLAHPSAAPDLGRLGDRLPDFVSVHALAESYPELTDLTRIELALRRALDAPDGAPTTPDALGGLEPEQLLHAQLQTTPHVCLMQVAIKFEILSVARRQQHDPAQVNAAAEKTHLLVWRKQYGVFSRTLGEVEAALLTPLLDGSSFQTLCAVAERSGLEPRRLVETIARWAGDELIELVG